MDDFTCIETLPLPLRVIIYTFVTDPGEIHFDIMSRSVFKMFSAELYPDLLGHYFVYLALRGSPDLVALFLDFHPMSSYQETLLET
jgi:hypothetical protein